MTTSSHTSDIAEGFTFATLVAGLGVLWAWLGAIISRRDDLNAAWDVDAVYFDACDLNAGGSGLRLDVEALLEEGWHPMRVWLAFGAEIERGHRHWVAAMLAHSVQVARLSRERVGAVSAYLRMWMECVRAGLGARTLKTQSYASEAVHAPP